MCNPMLAALLGLAAGCGAPPVPAGLLAPDDPRLASTFHPPAAPTAGLKRYAPVDARKDWGGTPAQPPAGPPSGAMRGMKGMEGMPGMGGQ